MREKEKVDVIILCGGLGTRFQKVSSTCPKALAPIGDKLFLDILIEQFIRADYDRFILCTGHLSHKVIDRYENHSKNIEILFSEENEPRGTGGAIKHAEHFIQSENFFVANGDSYCDIPLQSFYEAHCEKKSLLSVAVTHADLRHDTGKIFLEEKTNRILSFLEKNKEEKNYMNAGIYIFTKNVLEKIPQEKNFSLDHELFPFLIKEELYGFLFSEELIDIGTPERYEKALEYFQVL